tara:strand:+ start:86 stop:556 length:471 start_codon:yes stop_codon:yes gene_type:complete
MANLSPQLPIFAVNSTVKAWCHTGLTNWTSTTAAVTPATWNAQNLIGSYNLYLDVSNSTSSGTSPGTETLNGTALKFSFVTPMLHTKYKIFIQYSVNSGAVEYPVYSHALNSSLFPKLTTSFWIRVGRPQDSTTDTNKVIATTFNTWNSNLRVVVL